jgi:hypothetical protein
LTEFSVLVSRRIRKPYRFLADPRHSGGVAEVDVDSGAVPRSFRPLLKWRGAESRAILRRMLAWDFDRVVMAHGEVIETGGKSTTERAWSFLGGPA